eukprot:m.919928 g.919928  ORF g.919928 m.919928 type:complete len:271 (-) comp60523_c0_seq1:254-1066(-)
MADESSSSWEVTLGFIGTLAVYAFIDLYRNSRRRPRAPATPHAFSTDKNIGVNTPNDMRNKANTSNNMRNKVNTNKGFSGHPLLSSDITAGFSSEEHGKPNGSQAVHELQSKVQQKFMKRIKLKLFDELRRMLQSTIIQHGKFSPFEGASKLIDDAWRLVNKKDLVNPRSANSYNYGFMVALVDQEVFISHAFSMDLEGSYGGGEAGVSQCIHPEVWCLMQLVHFLEDNKLAPRHTTVWLHVTKPSICMPCETVMQAFETQVPNSSIFLQ